MEYFIANKSTSDFYCFERGIPTLEYAKEIALNYPGARFIHEYEHSDGRVSGVVPTGRVWEVNEESKEEQP